MGKWWGTRQWKTCITELSMPFQLFLRGDLTGRSYHLPFW